MQACYSRFRYVHWSRGMYQGKWNITLTLHLRATTHFKDYWYAANLLANSCLYKSQESFPTYKTVILFVMLLWGVVVWENSLDYHCTLPAIYSNRTVIYCVDKTQKSVQVWLLRYCIIRKSNFQLIFKRALDAATHFYTLQYLLVRTRYHSDMTTKLFVY